MRASIVSHVRKLTLLLAALAAAGAATAAERLAVARIEWHDGYDRLIIPFDKADSRSVPLLRRGDSTYRVPLLMPLASAPEAPRGLARFLTERGADGSIKAIELTPAPGSHFRYRSSAQGLVLDVVHGLRAPTQAAAARPTASTAGPLPAKVVHAGILFAAPRLAALRLGDELILIMPMQSDLDPAAIPGARVAAAAAVEQGRHRLVRLKLRPDTRIEIVREGQQQWRLGFGPDAAVAPARMRFAAEGRSVLVDADGVAAEFATLSLPELGPVAVVLAAGAWAMAPARSPYLDVLDAMVGGVVVARTDSLAIERRQDGIAISGVSRPARG